MDEKILKLKNEIDLDLDNYVDKEKQSTGGQRRASKGILTQDIYTKIINFAIDESGLDFNLINKKSELSQKIKKTLPHLNLSENFNFKRKFEKFGIGNQVQYDGFLVFDDEIKMLIEYKSFTEVSMLKRVFIDAQIGKKFLRNVKHSLCMLESAFGHNDINISHSAITLIDYLQKTLDVEMNIFILMEGNRNSLEDIGKKEFIKYINIDELRFTIDQFTIFFNSFKKS
tara:strand:- start:148 stop:831 length:684 start_codon:yes stop_codon:yes gene_type:complete